MLVLGEWFDISLDRTVGKAAGATSGQLASCSLNPRCGVIPTIVRQGGAGETFRHRRHRSDSATPPLCVPKTSLCEVFGTHRPARRKRSKQASRPSPRTSRQATAQQIAELSQEIGCVPDLLGRSSEKPPYRRQPFAGHREFETHPCAAGDGQHREGGRQSQG